MSYENAASTRMLATHCCLCGRPLVDADSVERGIGPVCMKRLMGDVPAGPDREKVNGLVYEASVALSFGKRDSVVKLAEEIAKLGYVVVAARVVEASLGAPIRIESKGNEYRFVAPFVDGFGSILRRALPGASVRWGGKEDKAWYVSSNARNALWKFCKSAYAGSVIVTDTTVRTIPGI